jgi:hypothetical protein
VAAARRQLDEGAAAAEAAAATAREEAQRAARDRAAAHGDELAALQVGGGRATPPQRFYRHFLTHRSMPMQFRLDEALAQRLDEAAALREEVDAASAAAAAATAAAEAAEADRDNLRADLKAVTARLQVDALRRWMSIKTRLTPRCVSVPIPHQASEEKLVDAVAAAEAERERAGVLESSKAQVSSSPCPTRSSPTSLITIPPPPRCCRSLRPSCAWPSPRRSASSRRRSWTWARA